MKYFISQLRNVPVDQPKYINLKKVTSLMNWFGNCRSITHLYDLMETTFQTGRETDVWDLNVVWFQNTLSILLLPND